MMQVILMLGVILALFAQGAGAAPAISGVSGAIVNGQSITITGTGFGTKATAAPLNFTDAETVSGCAATGQTIGTWSTVNDLSTSTAQLRHSYSTKACFNDFKGSLGQSNGYVTGQPGTESQYWYVSYWFKLGSDWNWGAGADGSSLANLANVKFFRMWWSGDTTENYVMAIHHFDGSQNAAIECNEDPNACSYFWDPTDPDLPFNTWHHMEFEFKDSTTLGQADGVIRFWLNGVLKLQKTTMVTRGSVNQWKRPYIIGFYDSGWNDNATDSDSFWMDDIYSDRSWARVMIGNQSTLAASTQREVMTPTSWGATSITATVRKGSFGESGNAYVFVVDSTGAASPGYLVSLSGGVSAPVISSITCNPAEVQAPGTTDCTAVASNSPSSYTWSADSCGTPARCTAPDTDSVATYTCAFGGSCIPCVIARNAGGDSARYCASSSPLTVRYVKPSGFGAQ